jgi:DNA repair exonuclease SbcCD ATPase subunit
MGPKVFTIRQAAEHCGVSYQSLRKRVDRGTIKALQREEDGLRLIPRAELERVGLWPGSTPEGTSAEAGHLRTRVAELERELAALRALPQQVDAERQARELAEAAMHEARAAQTTIAAQLAEVEQRSTATIERLASGSVLERWRARRELRAEQDVDAAPASTSTAIA